MSEEGLPVNQMVVRTGNQLSGQGGVIRFVSVADGLADLRSGNEVLEQINNAAAVATGINEIPLRSTGWKRRIEARIKKFLKYLVHWNTRAQADFNQETVRSLNLIAQSLQRVQSRISIVEHQSQTGESGVSALERSPRDPEAGKRGG
jgi:hypothetical protein